MTLGIEREGLADPLRELAASGTPMFGTCAGLIMLDREHLGIMDIVARRNAFGRQVHSFEEELRFPDLEGEPVRAVFIRAPWIEEHGDGRRDPRERRRPSRRRPRGRSHRHRVPPRARGGHAAARAVPGATSARVGQTTSPWRTVFSVTTRGSTNCSR